MTQNLGTSFVFIKPPVQVNWRDGNLCCFTAKQGCDIWQIKISAHTAELARLTALLTPDELNRANRYYREQDKQRFIVSRGYLRVLLGRYLKIEPKDVFFEIGSNKKPYISNSHLHYNVSHSGDYILIALSCSPIGVDVEQHDPNMHFDEIIPLTFSEAEARHIHTAVNTMETFYELWTRKEALLKATGKGIDDDLPLIPSLAGEYPVSAQLIGSENSWLVKSFQVARGYAGSVATTDTQCSYWTVEVLL